MISRADVLVIQQIKDIVDKSRGLIGKVSCDCKVPADHEDACDVCKAWYELGKIAGLTTKLY